MEPSEKELTRGGDKRTDTNLPFRAEDFNEAAIPDSSTALGMVQGTMERGPLLWKDLPYTFYNDSLQNHRS